MTKRFYYAWLRNKVDNRDDDVLKIKAASSKEAQTIAHDHTSYRFHLGKIYTGPQFKKRDPEWHALMWGQKGIE